MGSVDNLDRYKETLPPPPPLSPPHFLPFVLLIPLLRTPKVVRFTNTRTRTGITRPISITTTLNFTSNYRITDMFLLLILIILLLLLLLLLLLFILLLLLLLV